MAAISTRWFFGRLDNLINFFRWEEFNIVANIPHQGTFSDTLDKCVANQVANSWGPVRITLANRKESSKFYPELCSFALLRVFETVVVAC